MSDTIPSCTLDNFLQVLATNTMESMFGYKPFEWQVDILRHLYKVSSLKINVPCQPTFLCQPTGGGKSMVCDTFAATVGGITLNIAPLLALNADQDTKLLKKRKSNKIMSLHRDTYRTNHDRAAIMKAILNAPSSAAIFLFASPQALATSSVWYGFVLRLLQLGRLKLLTIDKIHLFAQFGLWFRPKFIGLAKGLFSKLLIPGTCRTQVPVLAMTATADCNSRLSSPQSSSTTYLVFF